MQTQLSSRLKKTRYQHSLGVAQVAVELAERFGLDASQARIAGLLHDCARQYDNGELMAQAHKRNLAIGVVETEMPLLLHAPLGAWVAKEEYGVENEAILQAIDRHTVGADHMSPLDKIVYFADMIEPNRDYPGVEKLRELARTATLDQMVLAGLNQSILFVVAKGHLIHPSTIVARNEIILQNND